MKKTILGCLILLLVSGCVEEAPYRRKPDVEIPEVDETMALPCHPAEDDGIFIAVNGPAVSEALQEA